MKKVYSVKDKVLMTILAAGSFCFGLILPDSLSDHDKLLHFSAHFGMSFLLAVSVYLICTMKMKIRKKLSYTILVSATLLIGVIYKYWEISTQGVFARFQFSKALELTGAMTSMSQNLSGLMAAVLLIEALLHRNLIMSLITPGHIYKGPGGFQSFPLNDQNAGNSYGLSGGSSLPAASQFSSQSTEK